MLNQGNIVRSGGNQDSTLMVINQIRPIYVSFTVPQQHLGAIKRYMATGPLTVSAVSAGDVRPVTGEVTFIDNAVDATTGTIRLKATFANNEGRLWPGQFANVTLVLANEPDAIVVPSAAVQTGQQGAYVFVVKDDATVDLRRVAVARAQANESVIARGLQPGEKVVVDGQPRLTPGAKVDVRAPAEKRGPGKAEGKGEGKAEGKGEKGEAKGDKADARGEKAGARGDKAEAKGDRGEAKGDKAEARADKGEGKADKGAGKGGRGEGKVEPAEGAADKKRP
jgi:multidrug efflux system membrane fusion protein